MYEVHIVIAEEKDGIRIEINTLHNDKTVAIESQVGLVVAAHTQEYLENLFHKRPVQSPFVPEVA